MNGKVIIAVVIAIVITLIIRRKSISDEATKIFDMLTRPEFIKMFSNDVKKAAYGTGLFPSVFMAQAILESSDKNGVPGNSTLSKKFNNFFGIKADKSWQGKVGTLKTREVINGKEVYIDAPFRAYDKPLDSFKDRVNFLRQFSRYRNVFVTPTPEEQAWAIQNAGYATDPNYAQLLINIINKNNLKSLDV